MGQNFWANGEENGGGTYVKNNTYVPPILSWHTHPPSNDFMLARLKRPLLNGDVFAHL